MIRAIGSSTLCVVAEFGRIANFALLSIYAFSCQRRRLAKWVLAVHEMGVRCVPIVAIVGLFTGLVMGLQLYYTLARLGAEAALGDAVALSLIRELGPVLTTFNDCWTSWIIFGFRNWYTA